MKNRIVTHHTFQFEGWSNPVGEFNDSPSKTVPGQSLSLKELIARYVRGENVKVFTPVFTDSDSIPDQLEYLDPLERLELASDIGNAIAQHQRRKVQPTPDSVKPEPVVNDVLKAD